MATAADATEPDADARPEMVMVSFYVRTTASAHATHRVRLSVNATVSELRQRLYAIGAAQAGLHVRLIRMGQLLDDSATLEASGIRDNCFVHAVVAPAAIGSATMRCCLKTKK